MLPSELDPAVVEKATGDGLRMALPDTMALLDSYVPYFAWLGSPNKVARDFVAFVIMNWIGKPAFNESMKKILVTPDDPAKPAGQRTPVSRMVHLYTENGQAFINDGKHEEDKSRRKAELTVLGRGATP